MAPNSDQARQGTPVPPRSKGRTQGRPSGQIGRTSGAPRRAAAAEARRKRQTGLAITGIGVVIAAVVVLVVLALTGNGAASRSSKLGATKINGSSGAGTAPASVYSALSSPSAAQLAAAARNYSGNGLVFPTPIKAAPLTTAGKPQVLYLGAEYCPYCAAERWPVSIALSKFGTFKGLSETYSTASDYNHTPTLSFVNATYTSPYLSFVSREMQNGSGKTLQAPTAAQAALLQKYTQGSIPFVDLGGKYAIEGAEYTPSLLAQYSNAQAQSIGHTGLTPNQVAQQIAGGSTAVAATIDADAGAIVSDLCQLTGGKPGNVCSAFPSAITKVK